MMDDPAGYGCCECYCDAYDDGVFLCRAGDAEECGGLVKEEIECEDRIDGHRCDCAGPVVSDHCGKSNDNIQLGDAGCNEYEGACGGENPPPSFLAKEEE